MEEKVFPLKRRKKKLIGLKFKKRKKYPAQNRVKIDSIVQCLVAM